MTRFILIVSFAIALAAFALFSPGPVQMADPLSRYALSQSVINSLYHPGYSCCERCGKTWDVASEHITPYQWCPQSTTNSHNWSRGCFPLCENCWKQLTPRQRLPYYRKLMTLWDKENPSTETNWPALRDQVLAGN